MIQNWGLLLYFNSLEESGRFPGDFEGHCLAFWFPKFGFKTLEFDIKYAKMAFVI